MGAVRIAVEQLPRERARAGRVALLRERLGSEHPRLDGERSARHFAVVPIERAEGRRGIAAGQ